MGSTVVTGDSIMNGYWVSLCKNLTCVNVPHWHMNRSRKRVSLLWFMSFPLLFFKCFCYFFASYCFAFEGVVVTCHVRIHKDLSFFCDLKMLRHIGFTKLPRPPPVLHRPFWDFGAPLSHRYELSTPVWLWSHSPGIPRYTSSPSPDNWSFQSDYILVWVIVELFSFQPNWLVSETFEKSSLHFQINVSETCELWRDDCSMLNSPLGQILYATDFFSRILRKWHGSGQTVSASATENFSQPNHAVTQWDMLTLEEIGGWN